jgi:hypothetical protein
VNSEEWVAAFAERLGVAPPDDATVERILELAGVAAHGSERTAAPVACYLAGLAGVDPARWSDLASSIGASPGDRRGST